jgi:hypothetical protein
VAPQAERRGDLVEEHLGDLVHRCRVSDRVRKKSGGATIQQSHDLLEVVEDV